MGENANNSPSQHEQEVVDRIGKAFSSIRLCAWSTREQLLLVSAVKKHGINKWDLVSAELYARSISLEAYRYDAIQGWYHDIKAERGGDKANDMPWFEELRHLRVSQLDKELEHYNASIGSFENKLEKLIAGMETREQATPFLPEHETLEHGAFKNASKFCFRTMSFDDVCSLMATTAAAGGGGEFVNNVICSLADPEGRPLGNPVDLPQNVGPAELQALVNSLLRNEEKLPYAFYVNDQELVGQLGAYLLSNNVSVEKVLQIVYQPQTVFRVRPVTRCSSTISGHSEAVLSVAFSPDGQQLASGSGDTTVRFWDLNTQTPLHTGKGHTNWVLCISWSPDGKEIVSGDKDGCLKLWDPTDGKVSGNSLNGHKKWITSITWEPAHLALPSRRFASASKDGDIRIWDIVSRKCVLCLSGHMLAVTCVKWSGEGLIYSSSQDCLIKVWETSQGKLIRELKGHGHWVNTLALSTEYVLRTGPYEFKPKQYNSAEEMKQAALARYNGTKKDSPERLVSGSDDFTMFLWEPSTSKHPKARMTGHQQLVNHVYFSPDGRWIASASFDKSVKLWNGYTGEFVATFRGHVGPVYQISWSADSRLLLSGSKDSTLKIWDMRTRKLCEELPGHADEVYAVDWSPDGQKVASGGKDRVLKLWIA